jgi:hypothetical protein
MRAYSHGRKDHAVALTLLRQFAFGALHAAVSANVKAIPIIKIRIIGVPSLLNRDSRTGTLHAHARWCSPDACSPCVGRCNRSNARRGSGMSTGRAARGSAVCRHQGIADRNGAWNFVSAGPKPQPATPAQEVLAGLVERVRYGKGSNLSVPWREGMVRNRRTSADRFRIVVGPQLPATDRPRLASS